MANGWTTKYRGKNGSFKLDDVVQHKECGEALFVVCDFIKGSDHKWVVCLRPRMEDGSKGMPEQYVAAYQMTKVK